MLVDCGQADIAQLDKYMLIIHPFSTTIELYISTSNDKLQIWTLQCSACTKLAMSVHVSYICKFEM